ncbi:MAG: amidase, partial [Acidobacteriaceae bacterium]|nr:amidase [Acidobacteriaceae bacterium]
MNIRELGRLLRTGQTSAVELVTRVTDDIRTKDKCNSLITSMREQAIAKAAVLDKEMGQGLDRGPFHGIPIAVKDLFYTRGTRTTAG